MRKLFSVFIILFFTACPVLGINEVGNNDDLQFLNENEIYNFKKYYWIVYDSFCPYCRQARKYIRELDWERKFKFVSYRDPLTYKMFPVLKKELCEKDVHMVTPEGKVLVGYKVFRTVIDNLLATKILNPLLRNDYAEKQLNEIYEKMVEKRSCYYNKTGTCELKRHEEVTGSGKAGLWGVCKCLWYNTNVLL